jgi:hypothetical protein
LVHVVCPAIGGTAGEFMVCGEKSFSFPLTIYVPPVIEILQTHFTNNYGD